MYPSTTLPSPRKEMKEKNREWHTQHSAYISTYLQGSEAPNGGHCREGGQGKGGGLGLRRHQHCHHHRRPQERFRRLHSGRERQGDHLVRWYMILRPKQTDREKEM